MSSFDALADSAFIREAQLVQSPKRPDAPAPLPFSAPTLWRKVRAGTFPRPTKLSDRVTAWKVGEVRDWLAARAKEAHTTPRKGGAESNPCNAGNSKKRLAEVQ